MLEPTPAQSTFQSGNVPSKADHRLFVLTAERSQVFKWDDGAEAQDCLLPEAIERHTLRQAVDLVEPAVQVLSHVVRPPLRHLEVVEDLRPPVPHGGEERLVEALQVARHRGDEAVVFLLGLVSRLSVVDHVEPLFPDVGIVQERVLREDFRQRVLRRAVHAVPSSQEHAVLVLQAAPIFILKLRLVPLAGLGHAVVCHTHDMELVHDVQGLWEHLLRYVAVPSPHVLDEHTDVRSVGGLCEERHNGSFRASREKIEDLASLDVRGDETHCAEKVVLVYAQNLRQVHVVVLQLFGGELVEEPDDVAVVDPVQVCGILEVALDRSHLERPLEAVGDVPVMIEVRVHSLKDDRSAVVALVPLPLNDQNGWHRLDAPISIAHLDLVVSLRRSRQAADALRRVRVRVGGDWNLVLVLALVVDHLAFHRSAELLEVQPVDQPAVPNLTCLLWSPWHAASTPAQLRCVSGRDEPRPPLKQRRCAPLCHRPTGVVSVPSIASYAPSSWELHVYDFE